MAEVEATDHLSQPDGAHDHVAGATVVAGRLDAVKGDPCFT